MSANGKTYKQTLTGGSTYDTITLPKHVTRVIIKSSDLSAELKIKLGGSSSEMIVPIGTCYDSGVVGWSNPDVKVNGTGKIDGEYWF